MTRALVTQMFEALQAMETLFACHGKDSTALIWIDKSRTAITAARAYLATEPSGERAELLTDLRELIDLHTWAREVVDRAANMLKADAQEIENIESSRDFYQRRVELLQQWQSKMRDPERTIACDIIANGQTLPPENAGDRYKITSEAQQVAVPEGYVLVPIEPTPAMCAEGLEDEGVTIKDGRRYAHALYSAMLAAAQGAKP